MNLRTLFFLLLSLLLPGLTGVSQATNLTLEGPCVFAIGPSTTYNLSCSQVAITWGRINNLDATQSGQISLELWAIIPSSSQGYKMATYSDGTTIAGNSYLASGTVKPALSNKPATGTYCVRLFLKESGFVRSWYDFTNFSGGCTTIQFGNIYFNGQASWQQNGNSATLGIPQVINYSEGGLSGALAVQLFATAAPFVPDGQLNPSPGVLMASYSYPSPGQLCGARYSFNATSASVPFTQPPAGTYYSTMLLTEAVAGGKELKHYINFSNTFTVGAPPATVATPVFSPVAGTYSGCVDVSMSTSTGGAAIRYTLDGTDPVSTSTLYASAIRLTTSKTVKARAFLSGATDSAAASAVYVVNAATVATPVITPAGGTFTSGTDATITCSTAGAAIRYTTDGSTPTATSPLYTGAISLTANTTLKARAFRECWTDSAVASALFTINIPSTVSVPSISPPGGTFTGNTQVTLSVLPTDATIRYTTDGTVPTATSPAYTAPFTLTTTTTVLAKGFKSGWTGSPVASATFTLPSQQTVATPAFSPAAGTYSGSVTVTLTTTTPGATIYYTTNGSTPTAASIPYTDPFPLTTTATVKAIATKSGWINSSVAAATYTVTASQTVATPVVTPNGGSWPCQARVTMTTATTGATIYYTLDGPDPNEGFNSASYTRPFKIYNSYTLRARAFKAGFTASAVVTIPITITPCPANPVRADCAWQVKEYRLWNGSSQPLNNLADAEAALANAGTVAIRTEYQAAVINHSDPDRPGDGGYFTGDLPFAWDNQTATGVVNKDDDSFFINARCTIVITAEDDYTFGFSSDDGARLIIDGAVFTSSTRLNPENPANPAHTGNKLSYTAGTSHSDTLGVCHLAPGSYTLDFLCWEGGGGAYAEVFAARGAKTAMDSTFRLVGHVPSGTAGNSARLAAPGWQVTQLIQDATSFAAAETRLYTWWTRGTTVSGIRFTSANDFPERDPVTFVLEGTKGHGGSGPWTVLASGSTQLSTTRGATAAKITVSNTLPWDAYRITFPTVRTAGSANSMQIAEVELYDGSGGIMALYGGKSADSAVIPSSSNSPANQGAESAIDGLASTKYLNFDKLNTGFVLLPASSIYSWINFIDPESGAQGHPGISFPFPANTAANDDNFVTGARASLVITTAGEYTYCLNADDGVRFRIKGSRGWTVSSPNAAQSLPQALPDGMQSNNCCADVFGTVSLAAGTYEVELIHNEITGGASVGLWHAFGRHTSFSPLAFSFMGNDFGISTPDTAPFQLKAPNAVQPPFNDDFNQSGYIDVGEAHVAGCNMGASTEPGESAVASTPASLWWTWVAQSSGPVQIDTIGSDFDTVLEVYTGDSFSTLIRVGSNDDGGGNSTSALALNATASTWYRVRVSGFGGGSPRGSEGRCRLNIAPLPAPPANDSFANATSLGSSVSYSTSGSFSSATTEPAEPLSSDYGASVWFSWTAPWTGDFIFDTTGSGVQPSVSVYTGSTVGSLREVANNGGSPVLRFPKFRFTARAGVVYHIGVDYFEPRRDFVLTLLPVPAISNYSLTGTGSGRKFSLYWQSEPFTTYRIQQSPDLTTWTDATTCAGSTGYQTSVVLPSPAASGPQMFFRILRE